ncbi:MAG: tRNA(Ile)-lysidine synthetase, partial [Actinomycetota bacterium]|nr:tRNA(Ile)-lysidine synthetase [Actinomycetota bacterium]
LSLAEMAQRDAAERRPGTPDGPDGGAPVPREAARCGKLVFRPQKPPQE